MSLSNNFPAISPSLSLDFARVGSLDPRITFARASTATYYDGVTTAKAEENLLLQSQNFTTSWTAGGGYTLESDTLDTTAPDGTYTAEKMTATTSTSVHLVGQSVTGSSSQRVFSFFAKKGSNNFTQFSVSSDGAVFANYDLDLGILGTTGGVTASIINVGNGWYRCVAIYTSSAGTSVDINIVNSASAVRRPSWTPTGTETIYIWGAQLEQRSAVSSYTPTTTQPITTYIPVLQTAAANVARFDHNPTTGEALGLLIEEQRTNLLTFSEKFNITNKLTVTGGSGTFIDGETVTATGGGTGQYDGAQSTAATFYISNASGTFSGTLTGSTSSATRTISLSEGVWAKTNSSITANTIVAPDGTLTGDKLVEDAASASHFVRQNYTSTVGVTYVSSVYLKAAERTSAIVIHYDGASFCGVSVNLSTGVLSAPPADIVITDASSTSTVSSIGNGWYRVSVSRAQVSTTTTQLRVTLQSGSNGIYTGNGYSGIYIWGAQLEAGAFPTSYIATTSAAATRSADTASMTGTNFSSWYNAGEGTIYCETTSPTGSASLINRFASLNDGTTSNRIEVDSGSGTSTIARVNVNGVSEASMGANSYTSYQLRKTALAIEFNNYTLAADTVLSADTVVSVPVVNQLMIGQSPAANSYYLNGHIRKISYYPVRIQNNQLQALTS